MNNNLLDFFMKTSSDLVYEINVEDQTINWYRDIHTILKYKQKINLNNFESLSKLLHKNDIKKLYNKLVAQNQEQNQITLRINDALGNYQTWHDTYIRYENKIIGICKYDSNIILQEQEEKTENILDSTTDLIFYKDLDLNYMGCNESFCNFVGLDKKDILGKNDYELFGWTKPVFNKISTSRALTFSWLKPKKKYDLNTNTNGEHRAFVVTGSYEDVFPLDIYPMQLLKACMYKDLDEMEALGAYEIAPEDFALTEFICVSKQPHQKIIREGLDLMREELG